MDQGFIHHDVLDQCFSSITMLWIKVSSITMLWTNVFHPSRCSGFQFFLLCQNLRITKKSFSRTLRHVHSSTYSDLLRFPASSPRYRSNISPMSRLFRPSFPWKANNAEIGTSSSTLLHKYGPRSTLYLITHRMFLGNTWIGRC